MKKKLTFIVIAFCFFTSFCCGQDKIERYCELSENGFHKISINFGSRDLYIAASALARCLVDIPRFKNTVDALNYMGKLGWKLVTSTEVVNLREFYLKKEFDKAALTAESNNQ